MTGARGPQKVHLIGIGGAGMSAIARVLMQTGVHVSGSDLRDSAVLGALREIGVSVSVGHRPENLGEAEQVVVSAAISSTNPEVIAAEQRGISVISRGEALAQMVSTLRTIGVSGTHGKTTTSAMIATILVAAGKDPTYLLGADVQGLGPGGCMGAGEFAVVEADEAYGSFLWLQPAIGVVTNVDDDHLDHYGSRAKLDEAFSRFLSACTERAIVCADDLDAIAIAPHGVATYGLSNADVTASDLVLKNKGSDFVLVSGGVELGPIELAATGRHNVQNSLGAAAAAIAIGIGYDDIAKGLRSYKGVRRRFESRGSFDGFDLFDDYAHHPAEIEATLVASRQGPWKNVIAVFQPHLYSRTLALKERFGIALSIADVVVVTDVYGAREDPIAGVTGKLIVEEVCKASPTSRVAYMPRLDDAASFIRGIANRGDVVIGLGAGDITTLPDRIRRSSL